MLATTYNKCKRLKTSESGCLEQEHDWTLSYMVPIKEHKKYFNENTILEGHISNIHNAKYVCTWDKRGKECVCVGLGE